MYIGTQMTGFQFYTDEWLRDYGVGVPNGVLWSITVDIQFYIAAIFLVKWLKRKGIKAWSVVIAFGMILDWVLEKGKGLYPEIVYKLLQCNLVSFLWIFLIGMCVLQSKYVNTYPRKMEVDFCGGVPDLGISCAEFTHESFQRNTL